MCCQTNHGDYEGTATDNGTQTQGNELLLLPIAQLISAPKAGHFCCPADQNLTQAI